MKKIAFLFLIVTCSFCGSAFADTSIGADGSSIGGVLFKPSPAVTLYADVTNNDTDYTVAAKHVSGDTIYFSSNSNARIEQDTTHADAVVGVEISSANGYKAD